MGVLDYYNISYLIITMEYGKIQNKSNDIKITNDNIFYNNDYQGTLDKLFKNVAKCSSNNTFNIPINNWIKIIYDNYDLNSEFVSNDNGNIVFKKSGLYLFNIEFDFGASNVSSEVIFQLYNNNIQVIRDAGVCGARYGRVLTFILDIEKDSSIYPAIYFASSQATQITGGFNFMKIYHIY